MKSLSMVVSVVVLIGGVFLVTFLTQHTRKPTTTTQPGPGPNPPALALKQFERKAQWDEQDENYVLEVEKGTGGHYDFLLSNSNEQPISLVLNSTSCKCASVKFGVVNDANRAKLKDSAPPPTGPRLAAFVNDVSWTELFRGRGETAVTVTVPPADTAGPRLAVVRVGWDPKDQPQATTLTAEIQANLGPATDFLHFEVPILVVPPIISSHDHLQPIQLGDLRPGDKRQETVYLWSSTRDRFDVALQPAVADPCIEASAPRPLTADELKRLPGDLIAAGLIRSMTRPKCGYAVTVTAYENRGDHQLELGPLSRRVFVNRGTDAEVTIVLTGTVRGSLRVGEPPDADHVDLRVFPAARGTERMVTLKSAEPGLELTVDHVTPDQVEAKLQPSQPGFGTRLWKLIVKVPPDALAGPLPSDSAIYLKTNTTPPRRIRIPVRGNASG